MRTNQSFINQEYDHQIGKTPLIDSGLHNAISIGLYAVSLFRGNEKVVIILERRSKPFRLTPFHIIQISGRLKNMTGLMPSEFARQPRGLDELKRWKATELRTFLLYVGPIVLKGILRPEKYIHFLSLSVSITILLSEDSNIRSVCSSYVERLLKYFVMNCMEYYGGTFASYNTHK